MTLWQQLSSKVIYYIQLYDQDEDVTIHSPTSSDVSQLVNFLRNHFTKSKTTWIKVFPVLSPQNGSHSEPEPNRICWLVLSRSGCQVV